MKDALGEPVSMVETKRSSPGENLHLTIDAAIQERTEEVLGEVGSTWRPKGATALVLDPRTGAVLALANWPRVDANDPGGSPAWARRDRSVAVSYEPGSTFKAVHRVRRAPGWGRSSLTRRSSCRLEIRVADRVIGEAHDRGTRDAEDVRDPGPVLERGLRDDRPEARGPASSTAGSTASASAAPPASSCRASSRASCRATRTTPAPRSATCPIGQGLAVTPMQMAKGYTAIANHGVMRSPYIVAGERRPGRRVLSRQTADEVSKMLEGVLGPGGTAQEAQVEGYKLAGKTGTAEKPDGKGGYSKTKFVASFIGYAPARDPRLLVAVMVDEPQGDIYGGTVAAPAFESIAEFALPYLRIPPG